MAENTGEPTSETHPRAWAIFFQLDGDNSGTLEPAEVLAGLEKFGEEGLANLLMQKMDTDGDGKITFKEFVNGFDAIFENTPETAYALEEQGEIVRTFLFRFRQQPSRHNLDSQHDTTQLQHAHRRTKRRHEAAPCSFTECVFRVTFPSVHVLP